MPKILPRRSSVRSLLPAAMLLAAAGPAIAAPDYTILHSFDGTDGAFPNQITGHIPPNKGPDAWAIYGTTIYGTNGCTLSGGCGSVFRLSQAKGGTDAWTLTTLYAFAGAADGEEPYAPVTFDAKGTLYGSTGYGGQDSGNGYGTVFRLRQAAKDSWKKATLYAFPGGKGGEVALNGVSVASTGALFGTTWHGGKAGYGTVFRLTPQGNHSAWHATIIYNFQGKGDGAYPISPLTIAADGTLFGTTNFQGDWGNGTVYSLSRPAQRGGAWTQTPLWSLTGSGGAWSQGSLIADSAGNYYGTATTGGHYGYGSVFEVSPPAQSGGAWTTTILYSFTGGIDGAMPCGQLLLGAQGALYGVTCAGGNERDTGNGGIGTIYQLTPAGGSWSKTTLHAFTGDDGAIGAGSTPVGLIADPAGRLYGTTPQGGANGNGVIFRITP